MLDDFKIQNHTGSLSEIIDTLSSIKAFYPDYQSWIEDKVSSGISDGSRTIRTLVNDNRIAGLSILKNAECEKKICSLFIHPDYRGEAWIYSIFSDSLSFLNTNKPVITIPSSILKRYHGLIFSNQWTLTSTEPNRYRDGIVEYGFNESD